MRNLTLNFELGQLTEVRYQDDQHANSRRSVRGKTGGPFRSAGSFQWTSAVKALALLLVKTKAAPMDALLRGDANSLAASLDYAISKQPVWLTEMFGCDQQGISYVRRMILRTNPERKRPGPVTLGINQMYVSSEAVTIYVNGKLCEGDALIPLVNELEGIEIAYCEAKAA